MSVGASHAEAEDLLSALSNDLQFTLARLREEIEAKDQEIEYLRNACRDYRGRWMNEARENKLLRNHIPSDEVIESFSQARPYENSPTRDLSRVSLLPGIQSNGLLEVTSGNGFGRV